MSRTLTILLLLLWLFVICFPAHARACPEIPVSEAKQRMVTLGEEIRYHNRLYYGKLRPVISDAEYDRLFAELVRLEGCFPSLITTDSPTQTVGASDIEGKLTEKHERPMLSLLSSVGPEAVQTLLKRLAVTGGEVRLLVQPKVDGLPVELTYKDGHLVSASTRGDGRFGTDVTDRVREITGIPRVLSGTFPDRVVVRGEIYLDRQLWAASNNSIEEYTLPRQIAAGTLLAQTPNLKALAALRLFPFELVNADRGAGGVSSDRAALKLLADWGFPVLLEQTRQAMTIAEVQALFQSFLVHRAQLPFAMDGIVVKVDDLAMRRQLGEGARAPFWAAAWKYPPETARTVVRSIQWSVGRTGRRTPVAEVAPVFLGGIQVNRVSLHNEGEVSRLGIATGDQIVVGLVGDVIPQVLEVVGRAPRDADSGGVTAPLQKPLLDVCLDDAPGCREQFLARAVHLTSKSGLNIAGLGKKRLQKLMDAGLIYDLPSIFRLKVDAVAVVPGFGEETAKKLTAAIRALGRTDSFRLVTALGIPGVGPVAVRQLSQQFLTLDALLTADKERLSGLSRSDRRAAGTILDFFHTPGGRRLFEAFRAQGMLR